MMMPVLEQNPAPHFHDHEQQIFYHQQHIPEQAGKMLLTLILPNGVPSVLSVDAKTPMMDLLVQAASLNKLNPSHYSLVVLDSNQHLIHFKANQTVGQIVQNCQLPQINGSSSISLLPKEAAHPSPAAKTKTQPFEITVRLQVNLPDRQKMILRIDPTLPLYEIKEQICKQKKYANSNLYTLRLPTRVEQPLLLGLSLAEYKTKELTLVRLHQDTNFHKSQLQSFDRLYRIRSESQPPIESVQEHLHEREQVTNVKQRPASVQLNPTQSPVKGQNVTSLPIRTTKPVTSHTSLHAYWNDPNFDTVSQTSTTSSTTKKRRAPVAPGYISPPLAEQPTVLQQSPDHHDSHESLTESINGTKHKRKAPPLPATTEPTDDQQVEKSVEQRKINIKMNPDDEQHLFNLLAEQKVPATATLVVTTHKTEETVITDNSSPTPIYSQVHKVTKETSQTESPYSTVQVPSPTPVTEKEDILDASKTTSSTSENVKPSVIEPPPIVSSKKTKKESSPVSGLVKIVKDHNERADIYQKSEKQADGVSYFRVAKSRCGKFETDSEGFVNNTNTVFDSANNTQQAPSVPPPPPPSQQQTTKTSETIIKKPIPVSIQQPTKGKQAYELLKKYENDEENPSSQITDTEYLKIRSNEKEKSPTPPIQLEVTERTTHISVTVESDRKQVITRASPVPQQTASSPSILAPKPFGKTITEYRTVRRIGNGGETTTTTTVRTETVPSPTPDNKENQADSTLTTQQESSIETTQQSGDSENATKN